MRVLIIEDNIFNAFCLSRLLESVIASISITVVSNSHDALLSMDANVPDLVIVDGELNLPDESTLHGPQIADVILQKYPHLPLIAWSDSEFMLTAFSKVFAQHRRLVNEYNIWSKMISLECIQKTWAYYFSESIGKKQQKFAYLATKENRASHHRESI